MLLYQIATLTKNQIEQLKKSDKANLFETIQKISGGFNYEKI
jgi:hypothetical protein